jgi:flagellar hook-basal body protein
MFRALHSAASGMQAQQTNIDVIANNMANVNTTGFKKSRAEFQDLLYQLCLCRNWRSIMWSRRRAAGADMMSTRPSVRRDHIG